MEAWRQYGVLAAVLAACTAAGLWGFTTTGGSLPYAKRFARALQEGAREGSGALVDAGRGVVIAGPIRKQGLVGEYAAVVAVLLAVGVTTYAYATRRASDPPDR
jgi:hypothetical protein